jgi:Kef-type K+ transport system membrane component KefB
VTVDRDPPSRQAAGLSWRASALYLGMLALTIVGFLAVRWLGRDLTAPPAEKQALVAGSTALRFNALIHILFAMALVILTARLLGSLFARFRQPPVIGEVIAGILLGPSLLGRVAPAISEFVLPVQVAPYLSIVAQVGVVLYMFLVGLELDLKVLRQRTHTTVAISHASIVAPFLLGAALALGLYPRLSSSDVPFAHFALFSGVAMSVTAFPVLARILADRGLQGTRMGAVALTCAAVDDVTAWCLLALVVSVVNSRVGGGFLTIGFTLAYLAAMFWLVRPVVKRLVERHEERGGELDRTVLSIVFVVMLLSAFTTELIGIHAVFGAFALGAIIPAESSLARELRHRLEDFVVVLLLPAFFAYTGLRTQIGLVSGMVEWLLCGLVLVTACVGKFGGTFIAARVTGLSWQDSAQLGVLMNTRGLMELIVLNIGLDLGVISPALFAMLVIMAIVTTVATTPLLHVIETLKAPRPAGSPASAPGHS